MDNPVKSAHALIEDQVTLLIDNHSVLTKTSASVEQQSPNTKVGRKPFCLQYKAELSLITVHSIKESAIHFKSGKNAKGT